MSWISDHPEATILDKVQELARRLVGTAGSPAQYILEDIGLPEKWDITDEALHICLAFDAIVMRCAICDWWCEASKLDADCICEECKDSR